MFRLKILDDAFSLFLIELALLLDPTFFSNSFNTMLKTEGSLVNAACFLLAPIKLAILQRFLCLRLTRRTWATFLFAAFFVYLAEGPLAHSRPLGIFSREGYYYLLAWGSVLFACLLPPSRIRFEVSNAVENFISAERKTLLNRLLLAVPFFILFAHFVESAYVHDVDFVVFYLSPVLLALGLIVLKTIPRKCLWQFVLLIDAIAIMALVLSSGWFDNVSMRKGMYSYSGTMLLFPRLFEYNLPLLSCVVGVTGLYVYIYYVTGRRAALYRLAVLIAVGFGWKFLQSDMTASLFKSALETWSNLSQIGLDGLRNAADWLIAHPLAYLLPAWAVFLYLAIRFRRFTTWFALGALSIWIVFGFLPGGRYKWIPEMLQAAGILWLVLAYVFNSKADMANRLTLASIICLTGLVRFWANPAIWSGAVVGCESVLLIAAGVVLRFPAYAIVGLLQGCAGGGIMWAKGLIHVNPAFLVVAGALVLFGFGIFVTFNKEKIIERIDKSPGAGPPRVPRENSHGKHEDDL